jgi:uncharacterized protein with HEPN domain
MSPRSLRLYLEDIRQACTVIEQFVVGVTVGDYETNLMLRSAIERQLTIIGEAMTAVMRLRPALGSSLPEAGRIIAFRNVLVHHYFEIEDDVVWVIITRRVPELLEVVEELLNDEAT